MLLYFLLLLLFTLMYLLIHRSVDGGPIYFPGRWPIIGHAEFLFTGGNTEKLWQLVESLVRWSLDNGHGVARILLGQKVSYVVVDPDDALTVCSNTWNKNFIYDIGKPWLGEGLLIGSVPKYKHRRKILSPAFNQQVLNSFMGVFNEDAEKLVQTMSVKLDRGQFDVDPYVREQFLESICSTSMGVNESEIIQQLKQEYIQSTTRMLKILMTRAVNFWMASDLLFSLTSLKKSQDKTLTVLHENSSKVINAMREQLTRKETNDVSHGKRFKPFLELLLEISANDNSFNDEEIGQEVNTITVGGHEATSSTLVLTLIHVGSFPEVQQNLMAEINQVFGVETRDVLKEDLSKLVYMEAVIKETLRLCPAVALIGRSTDRPIQLKNHILPPKSDVFVSLWGMLRHKSLFGEDAEEFRPERWLEPGFTTHAAVQSMFGMPRRTCIGQMYTMMLLKTVLTHILRKYKIEADHTKLKCKLEVLLKCASGHCISITKRSPVVGLRS